MVTIPALKLRQYAWYLDNGWDKPELRHVHKVGVYKPNGGGHL